MSFIIVGSKLNFQTCWPSNLARPYLKLVKHCNISSLFLFKQDAERQHREVVTIYRTHLLSAAQVIVCECELSVKGFFFCFAPMSRSFIETSSVYYSNSIWFSLYHRWHTGRIFTAWFKWPNSDLFFSSPMWHRSHMVHNHVSRKKSHGFQYSPIGFRPHLYVEINQIWIGSSPIIVTPTSLKSVFTLSNHAVCWLLLLSVTACEQTSASVPFVPLKPQNKIHTNTSLPLIYNHWWTHLVLITKKTQTMWHA